MKKFAWAVGFVVIGFLVYNVFSNFMLDFTNLNVESLRQRFSEVHFVGGGNDFGGAIFWLDAQNLSTPEILTYTGGGTTQTGSCKTRVRGIYYNDQRGLRLWPLDATSLSLLNSNGSGYAGLQITGGFYRDCTRVGGSYTGEIYTIYGAIEYSLSTGGTTLKSSLAAGTKLNLATNTMSAGLTNNFQYFNNATPLGYFYDSLGGIGFVGGELSGHSNLVTFLNNDNSIGEAFTISGITIVSTSGAWQFINLSGIDTAQDTLRRMLVQGTLGLSQSLSPEDRLKRQGNPEKRSVLLGGTEINSSTIMNLARKNAESLCRGKTWHINLSLLPSTSDSIICIKDSPNLLIRLATTPSLYVNKTIIMINGNIRMIQSMHKADQPVEIFVDKGVLSIDSDLSSYESFNVDGFPNTTNVVNSGIYLKGNFIVNGLIVGGSVSVPSSFDHKLHIEGKVVSLNSPSEPAQGRINQVNALFGNTNYQDWINLEKTFIRYCNFNGVGSDGTSCSSGGVTSLTPFVVLNGNFVGNLLR